MLYVFHVDAGRMMTFDMSLALESVSNLKIHIQDASHIPVDKQVLLISGGECLDPNKRVCSYSAGTDTNPIFLFSKSLIESPIPSQPSIDYKTEVDLIARLNEYSDLPATLSTVTKRAQLAQQFHELAREQARTCENLVHDQHLQQQGWSAVVANLEDIIAEFKKRSEIFVKGFNDYMTERDTYLTFLTHFHKDLETLQRIPVLLPLLELEKLNNDVESSKISNENVISSQETETSKEITLFEWISAADNKSTIEQLFEHCDKGLKQYDAELFASLRDEIALVLEECDNPDMKEVKGLGERLFGLETLMVKVRNYVQQQADIAQSFIKNQSRASNLKDQSIFPDLCASHKKQLNIISTTHEDLSNIRLRCLKAKEELSQNLNQRLKWVMYIEDRILEVDQSLMINHENLRRLRRHLEVLQQIHLAPATYLCAVAEVVRRRAFSQSFLLWASELACHLLTIHSEEVTRRKEFQSQFEGHFLTSLFPGMGDLPPSFATQAPSLFDTSLPKITEEDVVRLKTELPDLADHLNIPDLTVITNFFLIRSIMRKDEEEKSSKTITGEDKSDDVIKEKSLVTNLEQYAKRGAGNEPCAAVHVFPQIKDLDRGCESETDTEEFEKVGQSPLDLNFDKQIPSRPITQDASTLTEDNLQISRSEHDRIKSVLVKMQALARDALIQLRSDLNCLKTQILSERNTVNQHYESLSSSWENLILEKEQKDKESIDNIKEEHTTAINEFKKSEEEKNKQIEELLAAKATLEMEVINSCQNLNDLQQNLNKISEDNIKKIEELQRQIQDKELEKEKHLKEITDRLNREHKVELENIRSRFKLMTMERSPSDTSLEKSSDFSSLPNHTTLLLQMTENFELDKEKAVSETIQKEGEKWEKLLDDRTREIEIKFDEEKDALVQDVAKRITEEKDKQIDMLREREKNLNLECIKYRNTIQQLAESEIENNDPELLDRINTLQQEKEQLEVELEKLRNEKLADLSASVALCEGKVDATTSPVKLKDPMVKSEIVIVRTGKLNIESCKAGDQVLVLWDSAHESFKVLQESKHMFFLHSDYLEGLGLEIVDAKPNKMYCTGEVVDKEYCHARKSENRYKVPKGTKFFRVKVKPLSVLSKDVSQSLYHQKSTTVESSHMSQSHSTISTITEITSEDKSVGQSLPGSPTAPLREISEKVEEKDETLVAGPETPPVFRAHNVEINFAEDSGIVDQATVALDEGFTPASRKESESSDRGLVCSTKLDEQHAYISSTWLEMMISRVFSKNYQNQ